MSFTNTGLVEYCKVQLGRPYWYGTLGDIASPALWTTKKRQYPSYYSDSRYTTAKKRGDMGQKVHDCAGLIKGYLMSPSPNMAAQYVARYDLSANGFHSKATEKGPVASIPDVIGLGVWKNNHIGVYIGNGKVIEAKGFDYGVVESNLAGSAFTEWIKIPFIEYEAAPSPAPSSDAWSLRVVTSSDPLNIRSGPSSSYGIVGSLPLGTIAVFDNLQKGFCHLADGRGWCSADYLMKV